MKAKLIKVNDYYNLQDEKGNVIGTSYQFKSPVGDNLHKLSKQNCDSLFGVVDVEKLAKENHPNDGYADTTLMQKGFKTGFNKAMELNKDKMFTLEDIKKAYSQGELDALKTGSYSKKENEFIQSIQQPTEIKVEIEMEDKIALDGHTIIGKEPKLDENKCLILKKI